LLSSVVVLDQIRECCEKTKVMIEWLCHIEKRPFTLNTHYFSDYKQKFLTYYKACRENDTNPSVVKGIKAYKEGLASATYSEPAITKVLSGLASIGLSGVKPGDIAKLFPEDEYDVSLTIMASVRGYFQGRLLSAVCCHATTHGHLVAYKRFVDNIPLAIDSELVRGLENIQVTLYAGLGVNGRDGAQICQELMQESPTVASRREELTKKWERLNSASQALMSIG